MKGGALQPTLTPQSSGTPASSALANQTASDNSQARLLNAVGGKKRHYNYKGGAQPITIMPAAYAETGGPGQTVGANQKALAVAQNQGTANGEFDNKVGGLSRRRRRKSCTYKHNHSDHHRGKRKTRFQHRHSQHHKGCSSRKKRRFFKK